MKNWVGNLLDRVSVSISIIDETDPISDTHACTHSQTYIHTYTHAPTDGFSCEIAFAACEAGLPDGISFNDRFLRPWIALFADSKTLLLQQQPCDRDRAKQRTTDSPVVTGNRRIRPRYCADCPRPSRWFSHELKRQSCGSRTDDASYICDAVKLRLLRTSFSFCRCWIIRVTLHLKFAKSNNASWI